MANIQTRHPGVFQVFLGGDFSVQLSNSNPFEHIPVDQITEVTVNKDTQTRAGTTKFSIKSSAVNHYYITLEHRSVFLGQMREMVNENNTNVRNVNPQQTRI